MATSEQEPDEGNDTPNQKVDGALHLENRTPTDNRPHWADLIVPMVFQQGDNNLDPFDDEKPNATTDASSRKKVRGQIAQYAETVRIFQHRTFVLLVFVLGRRIRFTRWDHSGVSLTPLFDYFDEWQTTCKLFHRIASLACSRGGVGVGYDSSATRLSQDDAFWEVMTSVSRPQTTDVDHTERELADDELVKQDFVFKYVRTLFHDSLEKGPRYVLEVLDAPGSKTFRYILVGSPVFHAPGVDRCGTRCYVGYDTTTMSFVWLKDTWRSDYPLLLREGDTLAALHAQGVRRIPTLVCHGDVRNQVTRTQDFYSDSGDALNSKFPPRKHKHYRLCTREIGLTLEKFLTPHQLVASIYDAAKAHSSAIKANILHRDISGGNIIIVPRVINNHRFRRLVWEGMLIDWELAKRIDMLHVRRQLWRTGTMQSMSVAMLLSSGKVSEVSDDLESFFYVLLYYLVRYVPSSFEEPEAVFHWLEDFFDSYAVQDNIYTCGAVKKNS
ncbi:uncharacterized protein BXZ73DRAFT_37541, partial [Epithele typhae]|uniref:uncharacterized protein n=1 Tax=Epithele typhae TaxID=378194 RepID=UPI0020079ECB